MQSGTLHANILSIFDAGPAFDCAPSYRYLVGVQPGRLAVRVFEGRRRMDCWREHATQESHVDSTVSGLDRFIRPGNSCPTALAASFSSLPELDDPAPSRVHVCSVHTTSRQRAGWPRRKVKVRLEPWPYSVAWVCSMHTARLHPKQQVLDHYDRAKVLDMTVLNALCR